MIFFAKVHGSSYARGSLGDWLVFLVPLVVLLLVNFLKRKK